ncbi:MAG TPA: hypothetical protein VH234_03600 [Candidatus Saccharimonadales bacterium]|nr:hypothetical protein [Candidatus Saccharimonadales bacterium]
MTKNTNNRSLSSSDYFFTALIALVAAVVAYLIFGILIYFVPGLTSSQTIGWFNEINPLGIMLDWLAFIATYVIVFRACLGKLRRTPRLKSSRDGQQAAFSKLSVPRLLIACAFGLSIAFASQIISTNTTTYQQINCNNQTQAITSYNSCLLSGVEAPTTEKGFPVKYISVISVANNSQLQMERQFDIASFYICSVIWSAIAYVLIRIFSRKTASTKINFSDTLRKTKKVLKYKLL